MTEPAKKADGLKPCPFCGYEAPKIDGRVKTTNYAKNRGLDYATYSVRCGRCHARGGTASGYTRNAMYCLQRGGEKLLETSEAIKSRAAESWNRRSDDGN